jgi:spoIIIJ-associated protein
MEWVVTTAKTLEEAKDLALDQLGVDEADAEFEVLDEPKPGLFGRMRGEAKVRARVRPTQARPKVERRKRRVKGDDKPDDRAEATTDDDASPAAGVADVRDNGQQAARAGGRAGRKRSEGKVDASSGDGKEAPMSDERGSSESPRAQRVPEGDLPTVEAAATAFLNGLTTAFGVAAEVSVVPVDGDDDDLEARVEGTDLGVLIGPAGQTLSAIQELTRLAVQQQRGGVRGGWLRVDVSGYRVKRREALERFTTQVVEQVLASGSAKALEPMNSADRKVVHDTATRLGGVATSSEGEEPRRRVVIRPA